jgi:hypothetical protein
MANDLTEEKERYIPYLLYWPNQGPQLVSTRKQLIKILSAVCLQRYGKGNWINDDTIKFMLNTGKVDAQGHRTYTFPADGGILPGTKIVEFKDNYNENNPKITLQMQKYIDDIIAFCFAEG